MERVLRPPCAFKETETAVTCIVQELSERPVAPPDWPPFTLPELDDDKTSVPQPSLVPLLSESARAGTLATPVAGLDQSGSSNRSGTFIAIVALIVIIGVICIAMSAYFSLHWRGRRVKRRPMEGQAGKVEPGGEPPQAALVGGTASLHAPHSDGDLVRQQRQAARKIRQLDELRKGELFLGRFRLLGRDACIVGGVYQLLALDHCVVFNARYPHHYLRGHKAVPHRVCMGFQSQ